jgi:DNA-binding MarR family transcriptional regulator
VAVAPALLDEDERAVWQTYRDLHRELSGALETQLLRDAGLSGAEYSVLVPLSHTPGGVLRARDLCTSLGWDRSRLSHLIARMEQRGLVAREECSEDRRGSMLRLTDAGRDAVEGVAPAHSAAVRRWFFDQLSAAELETLATVFTRLLDTLRHEQRSP